MSDVEEVPAPKPRGRPRKAPAEVAEEEAPAEPLKRGRPRKVVAEEPEEAPPEPAKRGRPRKVVQEEPPPPPPKRARKQRDPSELEPAHVTFSSARGERSFAARAPRRMPQPEPPVEEDAPTERAPPPGPFRAMHHRPVSARQAAMENLMTGW